MSRSWLLCAGLVATLPPGSPAADSRCGARELKKGDKLKARLVEPVFMRQDVSSASARERGWHREALLKDYGELVCPIYARHFWDELKPYPKCSAFVDSLPPAGSSHSAGSSGAARTGSTEVSARGRAPLPPLTLSFGGGYNGADAMQSQLKRDVSLPGWAKKLLGTTAGGELSWTLSFGSNGTGIQMHGTHPRTVVAVLEGRKRWLLLPPDSLERLRRKNSSSGADLYWRLGPGQLLPGRGWDEALWQRALNEVPGALECVQEAGMVLAVPDHWGHATTNEGDCVAVGVQAREAVDKSTLRDGREGPAAGRRSHLMIQVRSGPTDQRSRKALRKDLHTVLPYDPLQSLRDHFDNQALWKLMMSGSAEDLAALHGAAAVVTAWLLKAARGDQLSAEHAISAAIALFPYGTPEDSVARLMPEGASRVAAMVFQATLEFWALPFDEESYRAECAVFVAAMAAEVDDISNASVLLSAHHAYSSARGDFLAVQDASTGDWRRCVVLDAHDATELQAACFEPVSGPGPAVLAAISELLAKPKEGAQSAGTLQLGQQVLVEEVQGSWAKVTQPHAGWLPLHDSGGQVVLGQADVAKPMMVPRSSGRVGWRAGVPLRSLAARLAADWSPRFNSLAYSYTADPTATDDVSADERRGGEEEL